MDLVIDTNCLQDSLLEDFLLQKPTNRALITDYAKREIQQTVSIDRVRDSLAILSRFPAQIVFLKGTASAMRNRGRISGLQRRLIDQRETNFFPQFCKMIYGESPQAKAFQSSFLKHSAEAKEFMNSLIKNMDGTIELYQGLELEWPKEAISLLRKTGYADSKESIEWLFRFMSDLTSQVVSKAPGGISWPAKHEWPFMFSYRSCLFYALHFQEWLIKGSPDEIAAKNLRNDVVDINFATFATFFDGLMTRDRKCEARYFEGRVLLDKALIPALSKNKN